MRVRVTDRLFDVIHEVCEQWGLTPSQLLRGSLYYIEDLAENPGSNGPTVKQIIQKAKMEGYSKGE